MAVRRALATTSSDGDCIFLLWQKAKQKITTGRSPGSQVLMHRLPEKSAYIAVWQCHRVISVAGGLLENRRDTPSLAYRCGGSRGIAAVCAAHPVPVSPVTSEEITGTCCIIHLVADSQTANELPTGWFKI
jgi:hypothetical protein